MASTERIFLAGVATSVLLIGAGFGGGVMLAKTALDIPQTMVAQTKVASPEKPPPAVRVVLPAPTEAAPNLPAPASVLPIQAATPAAPEPQSKPRPDSKVVAPKAADIRTEDIEQEKKAEHQADADKQHAEHAERRKKAAERERHRRSAERRARQQVAREQQEQRQHQLEIRRQTERVGTLAFDQDDEPPRQSGFFGD